MLPDISEIGPEIRQGYIYGWSDAIHQFCLQSDLDPSFTSPAHLERYERTFVEECLTNPTYQEELDSHIQIVHSHASGRFLKWVSSDTNDIEDSIAYRERLSNIYGLVNKFNGSIYHSSKGLRLTVPELHWQHWHTYPIDEQNDFATVAWAQMTQFQKESMFTSLTCGKLGEKPIYISFDEVENPNYYWQNKIDAIRNYLIRIISNHQAYKVYNPAVIYDLSTAEAFEYTIDWENNRPAAVYLPYSGIILNWDDDHKRWFRRDDFSSISLSSPSASSSVQNFGVYSYPTPSSECSSDSSNYSLPKSLLQRRLERIQVRHSSLLE
jgi:hypothetical protein